MTIAHATFTEHLTRVLHTINQNRRTGLLSVEFVGKQTNEKGEIFFERGETVFARTEHEWGETALGRIMNWSEVYYSFFDGVQLPVQHRGLFDLHTAGSIPRSEHDAPLRKTLSQMPEAPAPTLLPQPYLKLSDKLFPAQEIANQAKDSLKLSEAATMMLKNYSPPKTLSHTSDQSRQTPLAPVSKRATRPLDTRDLSNISWEARTVTPELPPLTHQGTGEMRPAFPPDNPAFEARRWRHGLETIFRAEPDALAPAVIKQMERRDRVIFLLLNGKRTISEIGRLVHRNEADIVQSLVKLLKKRYIMAQGID